MSALDAIANYSTEQLIADAKEILACGVENPLALSPLPLVEAGCAWLNTGLLHSSYSARDEFEVTRAIVAQALAAMMMDGYQIVKIGADS